MYAPPTEGVTARFRVAGYGLRSFVVAFVSTAHTGRNAIYGAATPDSSWSIDVSAEELKKLRAYYDSFAWQQQELHGMAGARERVEYEHVRRLAEEIKRADADFPGLLPPFSAGDLHPETSYRFGIPTTYYNISDIRFYLVRVLAALKVEIDGAQTAPATPTRDFSFVADADLRKVLERDYAEAQRAYKAKCWKSVIVLSGGAIEAMLLDRLQRDPTAAKAASTAPNKPDLTKWDLSDLINVSIELKHVGLGVEKLSHSVREYRNLVHAGNEIRHKLTFDAEEAKIALEVLHIVFRELTA